MACHGEFHSDRHGFNVAHKRLNENMIRYLRGKNVKYLAIVDCKGGNALLNSAISTCRPVANNGRVTIYDISVGCPSADFGRIVLC